MSGFDLEAQATAIVTQLGTAETGVNGYTSDLTKWQGPALFVLPGEEFITHFESFGSTSSGRSKVNWSVRVVVPIGSAGVEAPTQKLYSLLSIGKPDSLFNAWWADRTFAGVCEESLWTTARTPRRETFTEVDALMADVNLQMIVNKG